MQALAPGKARRYVRCPITPKKGVYFANDPSAVTDRFFATFKSSKHSLIAAVSGLDSTDDPLDDPRGLLG